ncbi:PspC domain-containing protein [Micromonospora sp. NPDC048830]|uniref:PspC domain-containing protein n=1 Tax=Micromonospora sp. NPDC048830 TaxID=3364257 RepID=UPI00371A70F4
MTEEAAPSPRPGAAQPGGPPPPPPAGPAPTTPAGWTAPTTFGPTSAGPEAPAGPGAPAGAGSGGTAPPAVGYAAPPPPGGSAFTSRYGLVRPRDGRYLAGVCAAIGRATNTDPVLWRVLLAVLGFFGGIGILVYVTAWLIIPGEGDTASPVESMLGRGRSSMSPVTVIVLSILVAVSFGYIVTDAFRAVLLGAAILVGGALLLNRDQGAAARAAQTHPGPVPGPGVPPATPPGPVPPVSWPAPGVFTPPAGASPVYGQPSAPSAAGQPAGSPGRPSNVPVSGQPAATWAAPPARPPAEPTAELPPWPPAPAAGPSTGTLPPVGGPVGAYPPSSPAGYRPPFAPHGPYATRPQPAPPPPAPAKPPKRPRERSPLGAVTFSLIFLALGVVGMLDLLDVIHVGAAAYFAAALATIGLGLLVGAWFGRARWLIALGLVTAAALGVATVAESYDRIRGVDGDVTWAPTDHRDLADRYENNFGNAVLDLRAIDFDKRETNVTVAISFGEATVVVPPSVDVTTIADVNAGDATVFGKRSSELDGRLRESVDLGPDGPGGGKLRLYIHVNAGNLEVTR